MAPKMMPRLDFSRRSLGSGDARQLTSEIPKGSLSYEEVDFSLNNLSSAGLDAVLDVCKRCPKLRVLKLFKNRIDDVGAAGLAELCRAVPGIEEMHLSHNQFTAIGVRKIVMAAEEVRKPDAPPLWLRLEQNLIAEPDMVYAELAEQLSVCKRVDDKSCTARICCRKCKVHLPFFCLQRWQTGTGYNQQPPGGSPANHTGASPKPSAYRPPTIPKPSMSPVSGGASSPSPSGALGFGSPSFGAGGKGSAKCKNPTPPASGYAGKGEKHGKPPSWAGGNQWTQAISAPVDVASSVGYSVPIPAHDAGISAAMNGGHTQKVVNSTKHRPSLALDQNGIRHVVREQVQDAAAAKELCCSLCSYVMVSPVITKCSHLVCDPCFKSWVTQKVAEHKQGPGAGQPMPGMPCPLCNTTLKKADISPLDQAQGPAAALLQRRWRNIQIRCVHHKDLFKYPFGQDAYRLCTETGNECTWVGDQHAYEDHLQKCCVECKLASRFDSPAERILGGEPFAEPEPVSADGADDDDFEIRMAKYDFDNNGDPTQLSLRMNDYIKIFEVSDGGWAAGIRLNPQTMVEVGEAGWFPVEYLHPNRVRP